MTSSSVCTSPFESNGGILSVYASPPTYKDYVQTLCSRFPSLQTLYSFLSNPKARHHGCRATALDFREGIAAPITRPVPNGDCLLGEVRMKAETELDETEPRQTSPLRGRLLIIEDLTVDVVELLGCELDIDPLFFAMHLHTVYRTGMRHQTPDEATLPSRLHAHDYINISYHRPVLCDDIYPFGGRMMRDAAIDRKLVFLRSTAIGLAQHRASVIKIQQSESFWIALLLVDPPLGDKYFVGENKDNVAHEVKLRVWPFKGAYEEFMEPPKFSEDWNHQKALLHGRIMNDVVHYWERNAPECFDPVNPTIQSLAYYPLKIIAAEWVKYIAVMQHCIKLYEFQGDQLTDLEKFNMDLRELQGWRRRSMMSQQKIRSVIRKLKLHDSPIPIHRTAVNRVIEDFDSIKEDIKIAGNMLENMLPVVTSLVQIIDARQSFAETANIGRLTYLALVFVPLSFVASLFSMNSENVPGSSHFWVYFAVAIPVTILVFIIARPPMSVVQKAHAWLDNRRKKRAIVHATRKTVLIESRDSKPR